MSPNQHEDLVKRIQNNDEQIQQLQDQYSDFKNRVDGVTARVHIMGEITELKNRITFWKTVACMEFAMLAVPIIIGVIIAIVN